MATLVQSKTGNAVPGTSIVLTFDSDTTSGHLIPVVVLNPFTGTPPTFSVADNKSNTYTLVREEGNAAGGSSQFGVAIFRAANITGGASHQVTVTSDQSGFITAVACEVSGSDTTSPNDGNNGATSTSTTAQPGSVTSTAGGFWIEGVVDNQSRDQTVPAGWTSLVDVAGASAAYKIEAASQTINPSTTWTTDAAWWAVQAVFKDAAAGGQPTMRRWGGVPFMGGQGIGQKGAPGSGKMWGRRDRIIVPSRFAA